MDKALVKKYFFRFLKEKEVFTEYKKYLGHWETRGASPTRRIVNLDSLNAIHSRLWIDLAFAWENSKSGADGWSRLECEWYDILASLKLSI